MPYISSHAPGGHVIPTAGSEVTPTPTPGSGLSSAVSPQQQTWTGPQEAQPPPHTGCPRFCMAECHLPIATHGDEAGSYSGQVSLLAPSFCLASVSLGPLAAPSGWHHLQEEAVQDGS